ncbi:hypothetical protein [Flavivirga jejuensis]|uniref:Prevent-host-death family protein n=1 Tax=Flavivirga jejuensis TaxID=870487 RepID=A0ABT8WV23_9FLAO|nr:hypothetical protein [Flavivirga jejuensis]MDO5976999.1 hypothetical protein [Flavivirga jejuensis]
MEVLGITELIKNIKFTLDKMVYNTSGIIAHLSKQENVFMVSSNDYNSLTDTSL